MLTSVNEEVREPCGLTYQELANLSDEKIMLHPSRAARRSAPASRTQCDKSLVQSPLWL